MSNLPCVEVEPEVRADAAVIWLHGLGANGHDFEPIVPELRLPRDLGLRFVFPHAPAMPVTVNNGHVMPAWYDLKSMCMDERVDEDGLQASSEAVQALIDREIDRGISSKRIVVAGFSQGGAVAYQAALTYPQRLGGILALSAYLATPQSLQPHPANQGIPIRIYHGNADPIVPELLGRRAYERLAELGSPVEYKTYDMQHSVCPEEIRDIAEWLKNRLQLSGSMPAG